MRIQEMETNLTGENAFYSWTNQEYGSACIDILSIYKTFFCWKYLWKNDISKWYKYIFFATIFLDVWFFSFSDTEIIITGGTGGAFTRVGLVEKYNVYTGTAAFNTLPI